MERSILSEPSSVARRVAEQTLAGRSADYSNEVERLLEAGRQVMAAAGVGRRARVADIVSAAGLSNDAFYRHFKSKDDLVAAILTDGAERLKSYLAHQMGRVVQDGDTTPEARLRRWVEGILAQAADEDIAVATRAVLWNADGLPDGSSTSTTSAMLATVVEDVFAELGSASPPIDARLAAHAVVGRLSDHLFAGTRPDAAEIARVAEFLLAGAGPMSTARK